MLRSFSLNNTRTVTTATTMAPRINSAGKNVVDAPIAAGRACAGDGVGQDVGAVLGVGVNPGVAVAVGIAVSIGVMFGSVDEGTGVDDDDAPLNEGEGETDGYVIWGVVEGVGRAGEGVAEGSKVASGDCEGEIT